MVLKVDWMGLDWIGWVPMVQIIEGDHYKEEDGQLDQIPFWHECFEMVVCRIIPHHSRTVKFFHRNLLLLVFQSFLMNIISSPALRPFLFRASGKGTDAETVHKLINWQFLSTAKYIFQ